MADFRLYIDCLLITLGFWGPKTIWNVWFWLDFSLLLRRDIVKLFLGEKILGWSSFVEDQDQNQGHFLWNKFGTIKSLVAKNLMAYNATCYLPNTTLGSCSTGSWVSISSFTNKSSLFQWPNTFFFFSFIGYLYRF